MPAAWTRTARIPAIAAILAFSALLVPEMADAQVPAGQAQGAAGVAGAGALLLDPPVRIKDLARVEGVRENQLVGLGLVVGLNGTGDSRSFAANGQMLSNMLQAFGLNVSASDIRARNVAAVTVTADLPPFARPGDRIDAMVSSLGDARSLQGGVLLQTPLQGPDGEVYAVAQGPVSIGGMDSSGPVYRLSRSHSNVGTVPGGAIVERGLQSTLASQTAITLVLSRPDFTTASRIAEAINAEFRERLATPADSGAVQVRVPTSLRQDVVSFVATLEAIPVTPDRAARVVINERTGTIVLGHQVRIGAVAISHGGLTVRVGQGAPAATGVLQGLPQAAAVRPQGSGLLYGGEAGSGFQLIPAGTTVEELVAALNATGAGAKDVVAILQAVAATGALYGELELQ